MKTFDKNTSMGVVFDKNTSMGMFDKNTSMGVKAKAMSLESQNLDNAEEPGNSSEPDNDSNHQPVGE